MESYERARAQVLVQGDAVMDALKIHRAYIMEETQADALDHKENTELSPRNIDGFEVYLLVTKSE